MTDCREVVGVDACIDPRTDASIRPYSGGDPYNMTAKECELIG